MASKRLSNWLAAAAVIQLSWTNPALNKDGTQCRDLSSIQFLVHQQASNLRYSVTMHLWYIDPVTQDTLWLAREGEPMSIKFALPCASGQYTWWWITAFAVDFSGNVSDSSNTISVTAPSQ